MKAKNSISNLPPSNEQQERKLRRDLHEFIDHLCNYYENPHAWPLTQHEQATFVRTVLFQARKIKQSEQFLRESVGFAAEDLAMGS